MSSLWSAVRRASSVAATAAAAAPSSSSAPSLLSQWFRSRPVQPLPGLIYRASNAKVYTWRVFSWVVGLQASLCGVVGPALVALHHTTVSAPVMLLSAAAAGYSGMFWIGVRFYTKKYVVAVHQTTPDTVSLSTLNALGTHCTQVTVPTAALLYPAKRSVRRAHWFGLRVPNAALQGAPTATHTVATVRALPVRSPREQEEAADRVERALLWEPLVDEVTAERVVRESRAEKQQRRVFIVDVDGDVVDPAALCALLYGTPARPAAPANAASAVA